MDLQDGDVVLYKRTGEVPYGQIGFPPGLPIIIEHVRHNDGKAIWCQARAAFNTTRCRILPDQVSPLPQDLTLEEASKKVLTGLYGERKASEKYADMMSTYERLVSANDIPAIDESKIVRESISPGLSR